MASSAELGFLRATFLYESIGTFLHQFLGR